MYRANKPRLRRAMVPSGDQEPTNVIKSIPSLLTIRTKRDLESVNSNEKTKKNEYFDC